LIFDNLFWILSELILQLILFNLFFIAVQKFICLYHILYFVPHTDQQTVLADLEVVLS